MEKTKKTKGENEWEKKPRQVHNSNVRKHAQLIDVFVQIQLEFD